MGAAPLEQQFTPGRKDLVQGCLMKDNDRVGYWPVEISGLHLAVLTDYPLKRQDHVEFRDHANMKVRLSVRKIEPYAGDASLSLVTLACADTTINLERFVRDVPELQSFSFYHPSKDDHINGRFPVRASRFAPHQNLQVFARTFGTRGDFIMLAENVSKTGVLISEMDGSKTPFVVNTIIEVVLDPKCQEFKNPIRCLGKVMRAECNTTIKGLVKFGVRLIDMDDEANSRWHTYVDRIERQVALDLQK